MLNWTEIWHNLWHQTVEWVPTYACTSCQSYCFMESVLKTEFCSSVENVYMSDWALTNQHVKLMPHWQTKRLPNSVSLLVLSQFDTMDRYMYVFHKIVTSIRTDAIKQKLWQNKLILQVRVKKTCYILLKSSINTTACLCYLPLLVHQQWHAHSVAIIPSSDIETIFRIDLI